MPNPSESTTAPGLLGADGEEPKDFEVWIKEFATDIKLPKVAVCEDHHSPWTCLEAIRARPSVALILGARGSGKSFLSALDTHLTSREHPKHGTRILGGSRAQSEQIYRALHEIATDFEGPSEDGAEARNDSATVARFRKDGATYVNGSEVAILTASSRSVRGPHVPSLKLDEVDEMDTDIRESAMGMCMGTRKRAGRREGLPASVIMTSTCHRMNGPMAKLIEKAEAQSIPLFTMCAFEVLETCEPERSGPKLPGDAPAYAKCPECPIRRYCYDVPEGMEPKAKRSEGHYPIDSLIQKLRTVGIRTFEADYLCKLSSPESAWFPDFQIETHVSERADFTLGPDVHLAVDTGVFTGAVFFQIVRVNSADGPVDEVHVFADHLAEGRSPAANAEALLAVAKAQCNGLIHHAKTDPAGNARTAAGPIVLAEYFKAGLKLDPWPMGRVADGLALLESFISPADKEPRLLVHPRCRPTIEAMQAYRRAKKAGQWLDRPADPQHPAEDLVDALRGGLKAKYPLGRGPQPRFSTIRANKVF